MGMIQKVFAADFLKYGSHLVTKYQFGFQKDEGIYSRIERINVL